MLYVFPVTCCGVVLSSYDVNLVLITLYVNSTGVGHVAYVW